MPLIRRHFPGICAPDRRRCRLQLELEEALMELRLRARLRGERALHLRKKGETAETVECTI